MYVKEREVQKIAQESCCAVDYSRVCAVTQLATTGYLANVWRKVLRVVSEESVTRNATNCEVYIK